MRRLARSIRKKIRWLTNAKTVTLNGIRLVSDKKQVPPYVRELMFREVYEDTERNILLNILRPGSRVVELGTGLGFIALLASRICGPNKVWTYEANPAVEELIRQNFRLNALEPHLHMHAVTKDGRDLVFNAAANIISSSAFGRGVEGHTVIVRSERFEDVIAMHHPDVLIMDVEGGEYELLLNTDVGAVRHILVELHPHIIGDQKIEEIKASLRTNGFAQKSNDRKTFHFYRS